MNAIAVEQCTACKRKMSSKRSTKKFCSAGCRQYWNRRLKGLRVKTLLANRGRNGGLVLCDGCGKSCTERTDMWVRAPRGQVRDGKTVRVLCAGCHSEQSRETFYANHPGVGPGWGRIRAKELRAIGIAPRKRKRPREMLVDPSDIDRVARGKSPRKGPRLPDY